MSVRPVSQTNAVAIYLRISQDRTGEQEKVKVQLEDARRIAAERGWPVHDVYVDNSKSAYRYNVKRPDYDRMERDFQAGAFTTIIAADIDRFTRRPDQLEAWLKRAESDQGNFRLITLNGECDTVTDAGRLFLRIKVAVARSEMDRKSARQKRANLSRAEKGSAWRNGDRPFGYDESRYEIVPHEATAIQKAAADLLLGKSLAQIAREWNEQGLRSSRKGVQGWNGSSVRYVLKHPRYIAVRTLHGEETARGDWPPILDVDTHMRVKAKLETNRGSRKENQSRSGPKPTTLLSGIARCSECGGYVRGDRNRGKPAYRCERKCVFPPREDVDAWVFGFLVGALSETDLDVPDVQADDLAALEAEREALERRIEVAVESYMRGQIGESTLAMIEARGRDSLRELDERIDESATARPPTNRMTPQELVARWGEMELVERRAQVEGWLTVTISPPPTSGSKYRRRYTDPETYVRCTPRNAQKPT